MLRSYFVAVMLGLALTGCAGGRIEAAYLRYEEAFVPLESIGRFDRWRQRVAPADLLKDGHPFSLVELGRRAELGVNGVAQDRDCAAWWYQVAYQTAYQEPNPSPTGNSVGTYTRAQLPQASVALKKLLKAGPVDGLEPLEAERRCRAFGVVTRPGTENPNPGHE